jgi:hypothetical protein
MAENIPNLPSGAVPPKPGDAAKVQPKKETVRINLPPKPTAAPTVRLPTPPSSGVVAPTTSAAAPIAVGVPVPPVTAAAPTAAAAPAAKAPMPVQRPVAAVTTAPSAPIPRPTVISGVSTLDQGLAIAAAIIGLAVAGYTIFLSMS